MFFSFRFKIKMGIHGAKSEPNLFKSFNGAFFGVSIFNQMPNIMCSSLFAVEIHSNMLIDVIMFSIPFNLLNCVKS